MGYLDDMTSERVDAGGVSNIAKLAQKLPKQPTESTQIISMGTADDLKVTAPLQRYAAPASHGNRPQKSPSLRSTLSCDLAAHTLRKFADALFLTRRTLLRSLFDLVQLWRQLDDTIMGGQSSSKLDVTADGTAVWTGDLIVVRSCSWVAMRGSLACASHLTPRCCHVRLSVQYGRLDGSVWPAGGRRLLWSAH